MMAPGAGFRGGTLYGPKNRRRPKKRSLLQNELVFSLQVCDDQKKKSSPTVQWVCSLKRNKQNKWCYPKMVTPGAGRDPSDATDVITDCLCVLCTTVRHHCPINYRYRFPTPKPS